MWKRLRTWDSPEEEKMKDDRTNKAVESARVIEEKMRRLVESQQAQGLVISKIRQTPNR